jgi:hypothetical protein
MHRALVTFLMFAVLAQSRSEDKPTVRPYFGLAPEGPHFLVSCRNNTTGALNSGLSRWRSGIRLDGVVVPEPAGGQIGAGSHHGSCP